MSKNEFPQSGRGTKVTYINSKEKYLSCNDITFKFVENEVQTGYEKERPLKHNIL